MREIIQYCKKYKYSFRYYFYYSGDYPHFMDIDRWEAENQFHRNMTVNAKTFSGAVKEMKKKIKTNNWDKEVII